MNEPILLNIDNRSLAGYKLLATLSMLYMSIMLLNAIMTNRYIGNNEFFILGGTLTSPLVFILDDIIAEIYGYKITRNVIISGFLSQTLFAVFCEFITLAPYPTFFTHYNDYLYILGPSLMRIDISGFIAYIAANIVNSYILTRWKVLIKGKKFWLRSIGSSAFSEALYSMVAILMMEFKSLPLHNIVKVVAVSFAIKLIYSFSFALPANLLVIYLKRYTGIDVFDVPKEYTSMNLGR